MALSRCFTLQWLLCLSLLPWHMGEGLWCFRCSRFEGNFDSECPETDQDPVQWVKNSNKFVTLEDRDNDLACAVVYDGDDGSIFHQVNEQA